MRFAVLGSGSRGNATLIESNGTRLLLDCGFGLREIESRLGQLDVQPRDLAAIVVTHEHSDHVAGVARLARRYDLDVWVTPGTWKGAGSPETPRLRMFCSHARSVRIDAVVLRPVPVPHDAREPCQFSFEADGRRLGILTDAGSLTPRICDGLRECDTLMLEANHDLELLRNGPYPPSVQSRVAGRLGHLSNGQCAELFERVNHSGLERLLLAHISSQNNRRDLAVAALREVRSDVEPLITEQDSCTGWFEV
jgi:phosphoribosyl 1,2-cyclic phosphodiesterase